MLLLAAQTAAEEAHDQLSLAEIGVVLAVIAGCCAVILLAGFGYFTFGSNDGADGDNG